jgi:hypothetical protein
MYILIEVVVWHALFFKSQSTTATIQVSTPFYLIHESLADKKGSLLLGHTCAPKVIAFNHTFFCLTCSIHQHLFNKFLLNTYSRTLLRAEFKAVIKNSSEEER